MIDYEGLILARQDSSRLRKMVIALVTVIIVLSRGRYQVRTIELIENRPTIADYLTSK